MKYDIEQLRELHKRVAELTGPDRHVDARVANLLWPFPEGFTRWIAHDSPFCNDKGEIEAPEITKSLDAAEELRELVLPGWLVQTAQYKNVWECELARYQIGDGWRGGEADAPTEPLARLMALLDALIKLEDE